MLLSWYSFNLMWLRLPKLVLIGNHDTRQRKYGLNWLYNTWSLVYEKECISASPQAFFFIYYDQVLNNLCLSLLLLIYRILYIHPYHIHIHWDILLLALVNMKTSQSVLSKWKDNNEYVGSDYWYLALFFSFV